MMVSSFRILNERLKYSINILQINAKLMIMEVSYRLLVPRLMYLYLVSLSIMTKLLELSTILTPTKLMAVMGCVDVKIMCRRSCHPLLIIFKKCIQLGEFPVSWKYANVQPVHKKENRQIISNYRPISLLPIYGKILGNIVFDQVYQFLNDNNLLSKHQSGFKPGDSTIYQLLSISSSIYENFEKFNETRAIFSDISKAFDKVWHDGMIFKLRCNGTHFV